MKKGSHHTKVSLKKLSESFQGKNNPRYGFHLTEKAKRNLQELKKGKSNGWEGRQHSEKTKQLMRIRGRERWQNEEFVNKVIKSLVIKPSSPEWALGVFLEELFPNEYQYVGDYSFWIDGRNPDFMNINGKKKLIELFGNHWHEPEEEQERITHFKKYGFDTMIVWESDLKNLSELKQDLQLFQEEQ